MKVRSIVEQFERMAALASAGASSHSIGSAERGDVQGLVTYYDSLADVEAPSVIGTSKGVRPDRNQRMTDARDSETDEVELERTQEELENSRAPLSAPSRLESNPVTKIPQPKSREHHLAIYSPLYVQPPAPVSSRVRGPVASYAAFAARIENSQSRLLEFEKDERWLVQVEAMKGRVEALKRKSHMALAKEVASNASSRKTRSLSECSGVSTASTASMSSMDMLEVSCE
ncbi:unnamed protein product [Hyaloperonospora brassicae]|uniref:Uncharacterized protein n=1 Tax=Hyaloperonospora brassicae TaxID=162125 RepID=A0AAV0UPB0_HYABA|nr:unnamed protein product [Hyaloperonospora brassicae]